MLAAILAKRPLASQHRHKALCIKPQGGCHWELGKDPLLNETCRAEEYSHNKVQKKSLSLQFRPHALLILLDTLEDRVQIHCYFCMTSECHVQILYVFLMDMLIFIWKLQKYHWVFICSIFSAANALFFYSTALLFFELLECFGRFSEKQFIIETFYPGTEGKQKASIHAWYMAICITYSSREKLQIANRAYVAQCSYHHNACSMPCMIMFRSPPPPPPPPPPNSQRRKGSKAVTLYIHTES